MLVGAVVVLTLGLFGGDDERSDLVFEGDLRVGGTIDELRLPQLEAAGVVEYANYSDRPLVINFFASWCPNCIGEMPEFERAHRLLGDRVAFLGVSQSDSRSASIDLAHETGITYDTAIDPRGEFFFAVGAVGMPTTIFVRPGGEIAEVWVGALDEDALLELVSKHLGVVA